MLSVTLLPDRDCIKCTAAKMTEWGCDAVQLADGSWKNPAVLPVEMDGEPYYGCPARMMKDEPHKLATVFGYYGMYKKGVMVEAGGLKDQPGLLMEMFGIIESANHEAQEEMKRRTKKKKARAGRAAHRFKPRGR